MVDDVSFDRDKTLLRTVTTAGSGVIVREGSECTVHFSVHAPTEVSMASHCRSPSLGHPPPLLPTMQNGEVLLFDSSVAHRDGVTFVPGRTLHAEALERGVLGLHPGSIADVVCVDAAAGSDSELGIVQPPLPDILQQCARTIPTAIASSAASVASSASAAAAIAAASVASVAVSVTSSSSAAAAIAYASITSVAASVASSAEVSAVAAFISAAAASSHRRRLEPPTPTPPTVAVGTPG